MASRPKRAANKTRLAAGAAIWPAILAILAVGTACAQPARLSGAWARATLPGQDTGVIYLTITAGAADTLVAVSSPDAQSAMLHQTTHAGGMSGMTDMDGLAIPAGGTARLAPGGTHIMLMGLRHKLMPGTAIDLTLTFAHAAPVHLTVPVQPIGAAGPPG